LFWAQADEASRAAMPRQIEVLSFMALSGGWAIRGATPTAGCG
jgi:hypothetical protein